jgi:hypothetical protein
MTDMKNIVLKIFLAAVAIGLIYSCSKKPDVEYTSTYKMSGEWFTKYYESGVALTDYNKMLTYNTSDPASGKIWVLDTLVWPVQAKFDVDYSSLTFKSLAATDNLRVPGEHVKVYEGKIIPLGGRGKSGTIVDSIYLKVEFTDDPGTIYEIRGHQRSGFFEDEY